MALMVESFKGCGVLAIPPGVKTEEDEIEIKPFSKYSKNYESYKPKVKRPTR